MKNDLDWILVNPEGVAQVEQSTVNPHPEDLHGKTVVLRWNGKHNGDIFLNHLAELMTERLRDVKIIKAWEAYPPSKMANQDSEVSKETAKRLSDWKPDIVIGSQGD